MGMDSTEATISQHYYFPNLRDNIRTQNKVCNTFQKNKKIGMVNYLLRKRGPFYGTGF